MGINELTNVPTPQAPGEQIEPRGHGWFADHNMSPIREMAGGFLLVCRNGICHLLLHGQLKYSNRSDLHLYKS